MSVGIDLTGEGRRKAVCVVIFKNPVLVARIHSFLLKRINERRIHFRKLKASKKRLLQQAVEEVMRRYGGRELFVWFIEVWAEKMSRRLDKLRWLRSRLARTIGGFMRTASVVRIVIGSDLEFKGFSLYAYLRRRFGEDVVRLCDADKEVQIADAFANYVRINRPSFNFVYYERHDC